MPEKKVNESVARTTRTGIQLVPSAIITEFVDAFVYDLDDRQYAALAALLLLLITFSQNALEDWKGKGFWLRRVPPKTSPLGGA